MHYAPPLSGRVALTLTPLEDRSVPSASAAGGLDLRVAAAAADQSTLDPQPVQVGTDEQGEAVFAVNVQPKRCNCAACRGLPPVDPAPPPAPPAVSTPPAPAATTAVPAASVAPVRVFGSDAAPATPAPVVVARTDTGYTLLAQPEVKADARPDAVSAPTSTPAAVSVTPFGGTGWRWGFADPLGDPVVGPSV